MKINTVKTNFCPIIPLSSLRVLAAALTEFSPERKKKQQHEPAKKNAGKKKQATVTKKMLRARPTKYHFVIPPNTSDAVRVELEQRQRPVST